MRKGGAAKRIAVDHLCPIHHALLDELQEARRSRVGLIVGLDAQLRRLSSIAAYTTQDSWSATCALDSQRRKMNRSSTELSSVSGRQAKHQICELRRVCLELVNGALVARKPSKCLHSAR